MKLLDIDIMMRKESLLVPLWIDGKDLVFMAACNEFLAVSNEGCPISLFQIMIEWPHRDGYGAEQSFLSSLYGHKFMPQEILLRILMSRVGRIFDSRPPLSNDIMDLKPE